MNVFEAIKKGDEILRESGVKSYKIDSEVLMSQVIKKNRIGTLLNLNNELSQKDYKLYENLITQRSKRKPIAYLIGKKEFWKYEFIVTKDVLIPRPETELIVEKTLELTKNKSNLKVLEIIYSDTKEELKYLKYFFLPFFAIFRPERTSFLYLLSL